jgi:4-hydroxybenzoate polyprenyltransferase
MIAVCVAGVHALATAADYEADLSAGHRTMSVVYGRRTAAALACAAFAAALLFGDFNSTAVKIYLVVCAIVTLAAAIIPQARVIVAACITTYAGFLLAATAYLAGF